jgi:sec-independent protein translocase protein TatB
MFDVGFSELIVIAIVALIVIGPERLPKVARTAGHLLGRLQRYVNDVKSDISREMQLDELKKLHAEVQASAHGFERSVNQEMQAVEHTINETAQRVTETLAPLSLEATSALPTLPDFAASIPLAVQESTPLAPAAAPHESLPELKVAEALSR